jgi:hypothetical protein
VCFGEGPQFFSRAREGKGAIREYIIIKIKHHSNNKQHQQQQWTMTNNAVDNSIK